MKTSILVAIFVTALWFSRGPGNSVADAQVNSALWEPLGLSGGGAMFTPAISPADPKRMMVNCDMSAAYVTSDGGLHWQMINHAQLHSSTRCRPAFHPTDPNIVYAADGETGVKLSRDGGVHWSPIGNLPSDLHGEIAIDPANPEFLLAGAGTHVFRSYDGGKTWEQCEGPQGEPLAFHFDLTSPSLQRAHRICFAGTSEGLWRSDDAGKTWVLKTNGLPEGGLLAFSGGSNADQHRVILYCTVPSKAVDGKFTGGVYRSLDRGESWQLAVGMGLNTETKAFDEWAMGPIAQYAHVVTTNAEPRTVYAFNTNTGIPPPHYATVYRFEAGVYKSRDNGRTWTSMNQGLGSATNLRVCRVSLHADGTLFALVTALRQNGRFTADGVGLYRSVDGAQHWTQINRSEPLMWPKDFTVDPRNSRILYLSGCNANGQEEAGLYRSRDGGETWIRLAQQGPEHFGAYLNPKHPGWIYMTLTEGAPGAGLWLSRDDGATWQPMKGLPFSNAQRVTFDPADADHIYVTTFGGSIWRGPAEEP